MMTMELLINRCLRSLPLFLAFIALASWGEDLPAEVQLPAPATEIIIGYQPYWYARSVVPDLRFPDEAEQALCQEIETAIRAEEARHIERWRAEKGICRRYHA